MCHFIACNYSGCSQYNWNQFSGKKTTTRKFMIVGNSLNCRNWFLNKKFPCTCSQLRTIPARSWELHTFKLRWSSISIFGYEHHFLYNMTKLQWHKAIAWNQIYVFVMPYESHKEICVCLVPNSSIGNAYCHSPIATSFLLSLIIWEPASDWTLSIQMLVFICTVCKVWKLQGVLR